MDWGHYLSQRLRWPQGILFDLGQALRDIISTWWSIFLRWDPKGNRVVRESDLRAGSGSSIAFRSSSPQSGLAGEVRARRIPLIGRYQIPIGGRPSLHRQLTRLFSERGVLLEHTSQLNVGGNMDFYNMLEALPPAIQEDLQDRCGPFPDGSSLDADDVHIGPIRLLPLGDRKWPISV